MSGSHLQAAHTSFNGVHISMISSENKVEHQLAISVDWSKLTLLRGASALYVLLSHVRSAMWWATSDVSRQTSPVLY